MDLRIAFVEFLWLTLALSEDKGEEGGCNLVQAPEALDVQTNFRPYDLTWQTFKATLGRHYANNDEEDHRRQVFMDNVKSIENHNIHFQQGIARYSMDINQFTDMTAAEFIAYSGIGNITDSFSGSTPFPQPLIDQPPASVDWRTMGYVTPVKDQGQCRSSWAFSTTGALEGQYYGKTKKLVSLSEQQLVDCSKGYGNQGCNGGYMTRSYSYLEAVAGINSNADYPYEGGEKPCRYLANNAVTSVSGHVVIPSGKEAALQEAVARVGPIAVAIDASHSTFQHYKQGVYYEPSCSSNKLNHAVLVVGYGTCRGTDYWIVKNSWGSQWGTNGYFLMARNQNNHCGIATAASYPVIINWRDSHTTAKANTLHRNSIFILCFLYFHNQEFYNCV